MRILLAPQELKGSLTAVEAVEAMAAGVLRACPEATIDRAPIADGGPGTVSAVVATTGGELRHVAARDPLRRPIETTFGLIDRGHTAIIECAAAAGISLLRADELDPMHSSTEGVGDLIRAALDAGVSRIIVGLGGSATNDGGAGMAMALGARMCEIHARLLRPGGERLRYLDWIEVDTLDSRLKRAEVIGATDVRNPLCGPEGASAVFGPQKGATPEQVALLDRGLALYAEILKRDLGVDVRDVPGAGAAGGLGAGLLAFCNATLTSGFDLVAEVTNLAERIAAADLVITGEGRLDGQSIYGKTTVGVARIAAQHNVPVIALCGGLGDGWQSALDEGLTAAFSIVPGPMTLDQAQVQAGALLRAAAEQVVRLYRTRAARSL